MAQNNLRQGFTSQWESVFERELQSADFEGEDQRHREYPCRVSVASMVHQYLHAGGSIREALRSIQSGQKNRGSSSDSGLTQARHRIRRSFLQELVELTASQLELQAKADRRILLADATGISLADSKENRRVFPPNSNVKEGCGFPVAQMVGLFNLEHGGILHGETTSIDVSEILAFDCALTEHLREGDLLMADTAYYAYWHAHKLRERGVDLLCPIARNAAARAKVVEHINEEKDRIVELTKPNHHREHLDRDFVRGLPKTQQLRMIKGIFLDTEGRAKQVYLVTTLTDRRKYPRKKLLHLYSQRWQIEVNFRDLKQSLSAARIRAQSPEMVEKQILAALLTYNLVRRVMQQTLGRLPLDLDKQILSFSNTVACLKAFGPLLHDRRNHLNRFDQLYEQMLALIAEDTVTLRPNRAEPRKKKFRGQKYARLTKPRSVEKSLIRKSRITLLT